MRYLIFFFSVWLFFTSPLLAQTWEAGGFVGSAGYVGDIQSKNVLRVSDLAFGAQVKRNFDSYWSAKLNLMHGTIFGADELSTNPDQQIRNLRFYSPISEASLQVEFNFLHYLAGVSRNRITPYLFAGVGLVKFNPKVDVNSGGVRSTYTLRDFLTEGQEKPYKTLAMSIPYGIGLKYNIRGNWNLIGEIGYRDAKTDYLDDVSQNYPSDLSARPFLSKLLSDPSGIAPNSGQRGDYRKYDTYLFAGFSLTYTFVSRKCPVVDN